MNANQSLKEAAKEQAGLNQNKKFQITDFNYNVDIVTELLKKYLSSINFTGESVHNINTDNMEYTLEPLSI